MGAIEGKASILWNIEDFRRSRDAHVSLSAVVVVQSCSNCSWGPDEAVESSVDVEEIVEPRRPDSLRVEPDSC